MVHKRILSQIMRMVLAISLSSVFMLFLPSGGVVATSMDLVNEEKDEQMHGVAHMVERNGKTLSDYSSQLAHGVASLEKASVEHMR